MSSIRVYLTVGIAVSLFPFSSSHANDWITPKLSEQPERIFISSRTFYDVERCVVYSSVRGWVYRTPDRPNETLWIDAGHGSSRHILWQLVDMRDGSVRLNVFEGIDNLNDDTKACFEQRLEPLTDPIGYTDPVQSTGTRTAAALPFQ